MNDEWQTSPSQVNSRLNPPLNQTLVFFKKLIWLIFPLLLVPASSRTPFHQRCACHRLLPTRSFLAPPSPLALPV